MEIDRRTQHIQIYNWWPKGRAQPETIEFTPVKQAEIESDGGISIQWLILRNGTKRRLSWVGGTESNVRDVIAAIHKEVLGT
jgi:hypothetical protein